MLQTAANTDLLGDERLTSRLCAATSARAVGRSEFRGLAVHPLRTARWPHDARVFELVSCLRVLPDKVLCTVFLLPLNPCTRLYCMTNASACAKVLLLVIGRTILFWKCHGCLLGVSCLFCFSVEPGTLECTASHRCLSTSFFASQQKA